MVSEEREILPKSRESLIAGEKLGELVKFWIGPMGNRVCSDMEGTINRRVGARIAVFRIIPLVDHDSPIQSILTPDQIGDGAG